MEIETEISDYEIFLEEDMPESTPQTDLVRYLVAVLAWLYRLEGWFIGDNLAVVYTRRAYLAPDIALFKGVVLTREERQRQKSYRIKPPHRPPPVIVFEASSADNWANDLEDKPEKYRQMGAREYLVYDPNRPQVWRDKSSRLRGWHYDADGQWVEMKRDERGWLWSEELESWLVPSNDYLRLYDSQLRLRLTREEAAEQSITIEREAKEAEREAKEAAEKEAATARAEKEALVAELEALREKLRAKGEEV